MNLGNSDFVTVNLIITVLVFAIAIAATAVIVVFKNRGKIRFWSKPIGLELPAVQFKTYPLKARGLFKNPVFVFFFTIAAVFTVAWFGGYLVVNLVLLSQWNNFVGNHALTSMHFKWNENLILSNGRQGGYELLLNGDQTPQLTFLMKQYNVTMYLTKMLNFDIWKIQGSQGKFENNVTQDVINQINAGLNGQLTNLPTDVKNQLNQDMFLWVHSFVYSNIFLTPMCQFVAPVFSIAILLSCKRDYASFFAPFAVLGGIVTIAGGVGFDPDQVVTWQFIFYDQQLFFIYHTFMVIIGCMWLGLNNRYSLKRIGICCTLIIAYIIYVLIAVNIFNIQYFTTALTRHDVQSGGSYEIIDDVLPGFFPYSSIIAIGIVFLPVMFIGLSIKNYFHARYWKKILNNNSQSFRNDLVIFGKQVKAIYKKILKKNI